MALPFKVCISIHASEKEATTICFGLVLFIDISIHASEKEATKLQFILIRLMLYFNPRLREGGDVVMLPHVNQTANFNPRLREGGDGN